MSKVVQFTEAEADFERAKYRVMDKILECPQGSGRLIDRKVLAGLCDASVEAVDAAYCGLVGSGDVDVSLYTSWLIRDLGGGSCMSFKDRAQKVADEVVEMLARKQADYGPENLIAFGEFGILVRATDKVSRLKNLVKADGEVSPKVDESIEDTWKDLIGYSILALMMRNGTLVDEEDKDGNTVS